MAAADAEAKITEALRRELEKVDKDCIRPLQVRAFRCSAQCAEDSTSSPEALQRCLQSCMQPVLEAEQLIKNEVQTLQDRLTRCAQQCEDHYRDALPVTGTPTQQELEKAKRTADSCLVKCCDDHIVLIPKLISKFKASLGTCST